MFLGISSLRSGLAITGLAFAMGTVIGAVMGAAGGPHLAPPPAGNESRQPPVAANSPAVAHAMLPGGPAYPATVLRVIDGDTFEARVSVWPGLDITTKVRLRSIDAPEMKARCVQERDLALAARDALSELLAQGPVIVARVKPDKYGGRIDADVFTQAGTREESQQQTDVSQYLLDAGLARRYGGGRRLSWCDGRSAKEARAQ